MRWEQLRAFFGAHPFLKGVLFGVLTPVTLHAFLWLNTLFNYSIYWMVLPLLAGHAVLTSFVLRAKHFSGFLAALIPAAPLCLFVGIWISDFYDWLGPSWHDMASATVLLSVTALLSGAVGAVAALVYTIIQSVGKG